MFLFLIFYSLVENIPKKYEVIDESDVSDYINDNKSLTFLLSVSKIPNHFLDVANYIISESSENPKLLVKLDNRGPYLEIFYKNNSIQQFSSIPDLMSLESIMYSLLHKQDVMLMEECDIPVFIQKSPFSILTTKENFQKIHEIVFSMNSPKQFINVACVKKNLYMRLFGENADFVFHCRSTNNTLFLTMNDDLESIYKHSPKELTFSELRQLNQDLVIFFDFNNDQRDRDAFFDFSQEKKRRNSYVMDERNRNFLLPLLEADIINSDTCLLIHGVKGTYTAITIDEINDVDSYVSSREIKKYTINEPFNSKKYYPAIQLNTHNYNEFFENNDFPVVLYYNDDGDGEIVTSYINCARMTKTPLGLINMQKNAPIEQYPLIDKSKASIVVHISDQIYIQMTGQITPDNIYHFLVETQKRMTVTELPQITMTPNEIYKMRNDITGYNDNGTMYIKTWPGVYKNIDEILQLNQSLSYMKEDPSYTQWASSRKNSFNDEWINNHKSKQLHHFMENDKARKYYLSFFTQRDRMYVNSIVNDPSIVLWKTGQYRYIAHQLEE